ncbi:MAG: gliding motility lipoprotein GldH [Lutibacter sp.]|nr:gliding motility lipoprotein GldH [Lutibacter sp.]MBP9600556.1 gliding motility lipoprotein GldH [Lutibacter sp.]
MHKFVVLISIGFILLSCTEKKYYDQYQAVEGMEWQQNSPIEFSVLNTDTISKKNVFINIRNNSKYEYSSLFLIVKTEFPSGYKLVDTLEYEMTDAEGNWLGKGFTNLKENKLFFKEGVVLPETGDFKFLIQHATRGINDIEGKKPLTGITDVGLSIEYTK